MSCHPGRECPACGTQTLQMSLQETCRPPLHASRLAAGWQQASCICHLQVCLSQSLHPKASCCCCCHANSPLLLLCPAPPPPPRKHAAIGPHTPQSCCTCQATGECTHQGGRAADLEASGIVLGAVAGALELVLSLKGQMRSAESGQGGRCGGSVACGRSDASACPAMAKQAGNCSRRPRHSRRPRARRSQDECTRRSGRSSQCRCR